MALGILGRAAAAFQMLGVDRLLQRFTGRARRAADFGPAWPKVEADWYRHMETVFATEGAAAGAPWATLSPAYSAWKDLHYPGKPTLQASGGLLESLTGGRESVRELRPDGLILGSRLKTRSGRVLASLHQYGGGPLPARPIINLQAEQIRETNEALAAHLGGDG